MGIILSFLPRVDNNTMCCVDVTTRKTVWGEQVYVEPRAHVHHYVNIEHHYAHPGDKPFDVRDYELNS